MTIQATKRPFATKKPSLAPMQKIQRQSYQSIRDYKPKYFGVKPQIQLPEGYRQSSAASTQAMHASQSPQPQSIYTNANTALR